MLSVSVDLKKIPFYLISSNLNAFVGSLLEAKMKIFFVYKFCKKCYTYIIAVLCAEYSLHPLRRHQESCLAEGEDGHLHGEIC
jgi:hypothetical protein